MQTNGLRHDWTWEEVQAIYNRPMLDAVFAAQAIHRQYFPDGGVQLCQLLSVKTGGCPEDCAYCPQSAHYQTGVARDELLPVAETLERAAAARAQGATRFCLGAAWRDVPDGPAFERVLDMVRGVRAMGMEACCTLGMLTQPQADALAAAGRRAADRCARTRAHDCHGAHSDAGLAGAFERRPALAVGRGAGAVLRRGRQLGVPRRAPPDDAESRGRARCAAARTPRPAAD